MVMVVVVVGFMVVVLCWLGCSCGWWLVEVVVVLVVFLVVFLKWLGCCSVVVAVVKMAVSKVFEAIDGLRHYKNKSFVHSMTVAVVVLYVGGGCVVCWWWWWSRQYSIWVLERQS